MKHITAYMQNLSNLEFLLLLGFLFCIPLSIAVCNIFLFVILVMFFYRLARGEKWPQLPRFFYYFLIFAGLTLISSFFAINPITSIKDCKELLILLLFPVFVNILNSEKRVRLSLVVVLIAQVISSLIGLFQAYYSGVTLDHRIKGLTSHWMTFSGLLLIVIIYYFIIGYYQTKWSQKFLSWLPLIPILAALAASLTRAMWVGLAAALCAFFIMVKPKHLLIAILLIVAGLSIAPAPVKQRLFSVVDLQNETNRDRIYMSYAAWHIFLDHPLTGVGPDNILAVYPRYKHPQATIINMHLHNNFLQILAERGIFALASFLLVFFILLKDLWARQKKMLAPFSIRSRAVLFVMVGFLIAGFFEYNFGHSQMKFLLFYFMIIPFLENQDTPLINAPLY